MMRCPSLHFSGKKIFLLILIAASTVLIPHLNQNQIGLAQGQNNQTSSSLTNQQRPIHVGSGPTGIAFDPKNGNLYVTNSRDKSVSVISGENDTVIRTIPCCVQYTYNKVSPWGIAFDLTNGNLYVTGSAESPPVISSGGISVISGQNNTVIKNIPCCAADGSPWGIAFDSANGNLYVTNTQDFSVSVVSGKNNTVIGSPIMVGKVPPGGPYAIAFDSANGNLYVPILHNYTGHSDIR
jgi:YVTN family beta-propeller protein